MYCPKCGAQNDDNAFKCIKCGTVIQQVPITTGQAKKSNAAVIVLVVTGAVLGLLAVIGILAAIAIPQFTAYRVRACDAQAHTEIQEACNAATSFFMEHPGKIVTLYDLRERDVGMPSDIELVIEDATRENLTIRARHKKGKKVYLADKYCNIHETKP